MSENKDPSIKLFGKMIQLGSKSNEDYVIDYGSELSVDGQSTGSDQNLLCSKQDDNRGDEKSAIGESITNQEDEQIQSSIKVLEESKTQSSPSTITNNPKTLSNECKDLPNKEDQNSDQTLNSTNSISQDPPKKPDKILPCPRCTSMETKFCYFNNYNVKQPRHFCKNCQRYWTAGGTMRNVPVGAGRRKSKNSNHHHHLLTTNPNPPDGLTHHRALSPCGSTLSFGPDDSPVSGLPLSFYSATHYPTGSCTLQWFPLPITPSLTFPTDQSSTSSSPNSQSLGKHSRDEPFGENKSENLPRVSRPKILRIDDPTEAAKSSICGILGTKNVGNFGSSNRSGGFFRGFQQPKASDHHHERTNLSAETSFMVWQANPAAFSRSLSFREIAN